MVYLQEGEPNTSDSVAWNRRDPPGSSTSTSDALVLLPHHSLETHSPHFTVGNDEVQSGQVPNLRTPNR